MNVTHQQAMRAAIRNLWKHRRSDHCRFLLRRYVADYRIAYPKRA